MSKPTEYRIEERITDRATGQVRVEFVDEYDNRGDALGYFAFLAHRSREHFPEDDYRPGSGKRLVLIGPAPSGQPMTPHRRRWFR